MKYLFLTLILPTCALVSCAPLNGPAVVPRTSVEALERQAPVTNKPDVGEGQAARAATRYINGRPHGYGYGYGYRGY